MLVLEFSQVPYGFTIRKPLQKPHSWAERGRIKIEIKKTSRQIASLSAKTLT